jgi:hypothetical protein
LAAPRVDSARAHLGCVVRVRGALRSLSLDAAIKEALDDYDGRLFRRRSPARPWWATVLASKRRRR